MPERKLLCHGLLLCYILFFSSSLRGQADLESLSPLPGRNIALHSSFVRIADGIIIYPDQAWSGNTAAVKLQVVADNIIRVTAIPVPFSRPSNATDGNSPDPAHSSNGGGLAAGGDLNPTGSHPNPDSAFSGPASLITVYASDPRVKWHVIQDSNTIRLITSRITASVSIPTGAVRFTDPAGSLILAERTASGRNFEAAVFDGSPSFHIRQSFQIRGEEALYGLGQHQDGIINYKGRQVNLFQNNTEVAVPFLVSNNNYGILWDNYSLTSVGDIRPAKPLSALRLFSARGEEGWLTTSYSNDKDRPDGKENESASSDIDYTYLGDSKRMLPPDFRPVRGMMTWEGALSAGRTGRYQFRFLYGGYIKVWMDGRLVVDRWRQAWNPGTALIDLDLVKERKTPLRIQWIPDGEESYLSVKFIDPLPPASENDFSFLSEAGKQLDYYFIRGKDMDEVIAGYRFITGKATIAPKWAMGFWQSRERYKTQDEILQTVKEFRLRRIPLDNIVLDWSYWQQDAWGSQEFDARRFPAPDSMIQSLHSDYHTHFMISVWPKFYKGIPAYNQFDKNNWLYKRNIADNQRDWIGQGYISTFYDAFNKDARKGFWDLINTKLYSKGIDAWWMDASEPDILSNVSPEKRKAQMTPTAAGSAAEYLNAYPLENAKGIYEGQRATDSDRRVFILTRSAFAGSQHYAATVWSGDIAARWSDMKDQITAGINFSLSGLPYWTMDIGGFAVERRYLQPGAKDLEEWREQMTRWYQFGAFCPIFRVHGQFPYREIFNTAPTDHPAYKSMLFYDQLRYRLLPYTYTLAGLTWLKDYTIMRGLAMDFPGDTAVNNIGDQYLFGPSLLVAPVTTYGATSRSLYLPAGQGWYDLYTGTYLEGGRHVDAAAPYERMPLYVKEGSIIPMGPALQYTTEKKADPITLYVYTGKDASFDLYEDEGSNYQYEKGKYSIIRFRYDQASGTLTIGHQDGSFPGMLKQRTFRVIWVSKSKPAPFPSDGPADLTLTYKGEQQQLHINHKSASH
ncbi:MAG TPA: TIM-barrel domain-containing protein [Puia sp.]|nr:TIM-barrel domain-containing protein [Puia sp.]